MNCEHVSKFYFGYYLCKKCGLLDEFVLGQYEETEEGKQFLERKRQSYIDQQNLCLQANTSVLGGGYYSEHIPYEVRSNYKFRKPTSSNQQRVYRGYRGTVPQQYRDEFDEVFESVGGKRCARKRRLILAKHKICLRYGLPFCLEEEVKRLRGKVRVSEKDLE